jgi:2-oxoglutarate ferredoxin oxidoreductase subunit delta
MIIMPLRLWRKPLDSDKIKVPKGEVHILKDRCKGCGFCIEFCPKEVLEQSEEFNTKGVHPPKVKEGAICVHCSFCEAVCPDFAIFSVEKNCKGGC